MTGSALVETGGALALALAVSALLTPPVTAKLRRWGFGQRIRDDGPATHGKKEGTPSAGGVVMIVAVCAVSLIVERASPAVLAACLLILGCGAAGFLDDYRKAFFKRSLGLRARQKILILLVLAAVFSWVAISLLGQGRDMGVPWGGTIALSAAEASVVSILAILFFTNAVNLTDGLDGLAAGSVAIVSVAMSGFLLARGRPQEAVLCGATAGACLGFLLFNAHPASVFMGDTGALALGGALAGAAVLGGGVFLLCVAGLVFVLEAFSVMAQVASFQLTGKRIFRMSPLHHHFELKGVEERRVVRGFWLAATAFSALGVTLFGRL